MNNENHIMVDSPSLGRLNLTVAIVCACLSWILIHRWGQRKKKGPKTWPILGSAIEQIQNYDGMHDWMAQYLSKWRTVTVPMPFVTYTYTADPENVEYVLKTNFANYPKVGSKLCFFFLFQLSF